MDDIDKLLTHEDDIHGELRGVQNDKLPVEDEGQGEIAERELDRDHAKGTDA